jgi:uncharacterized protein YukE
MPAILGRSVGVARGAARAAAPFAEPPGTQCCGQRRQARADPRQAARMRIEVSPESLESAGSSLAQISDRLQRHRISMTRHTRVYSDGLAPAVRLELRHVEHDFARALDRITTGYDELAKALHQVASLYRSVDAEVVP